ncbi:hypothetical protein B0J14DRAFT_638658 [Halenospora varia]|nr:hypothetical protein B0J14DRAFT_638658 [Halenospora varia]
MFLSQVDNLPNHHNCSLFLTNIPLSTKYSDIFKRITTGAVFALHLMKAKDEHPTQGAKLVFMNSSSAAEYIASQPTVHGSQIQIRYNRHGYLNNYVNYSRVLVLEGPVALMGQKFWLGYFGHYSLCNFEPVRYLPSKAVGTLRMEFRFIRIDGQAETCMQAVQ